MSQPVSGFVQAYVSTESYLSRLGECASELLPSQVFPLGAISGPLALPGGEGGGDSLVND